MVLNSTATHGEANSSKTKLIINTSDFNGDELNDFITLSEQIERNERLRSVRRRSQCGSTPTLTAKKTHEEIFETSALDGDMFLTALENQTAYMPQVTDLDESIENIMKYFEEDVNIRSTAESTPTKMGGPGKVAAVVDKLIAKTKQPNGSPRKRQSKYQPEVRANIQELRKNFETAEILGANSSTPKPAQKQKSPKMSRKSKVKQMAQLFNTKITQIMRKDVDAVNYEQLQNEFSPEPKPIVLPKRQPMPKPRTKLPIYVSSPGVRRSPVPSPRFRRKQIVREALELPNKALTPSPAMARRDSISTNTCLVAEDVFRQLSVKDKALLYNKFIEEVSKRNPIFGKHAEFIENKVKKQFARGEVVNEKQMSVKTLKEELEAKCSLPRQTISPWAVKRLHASYSYEPSPTSQPPPNNRPAKAKEAEDILTKTCVLDDDEDEPEHDEQEELHISTLTVVLKPSPLRTNEVRLSYARRRRDARYLTTLGIVTEPISSKRSNSAMHSSLPIEAYAPPKKIRRTRAERLAPKKFFQNHHLERLFYSWLKERNGVSFDITSVNKDETIDITCEEQLESILDLGDKIDSAEKSAVDRLLEEAKAKLETVEQAAKVNVKNIEPHNKNVEENEKAWEPITEHRESIPQTPRRTQRKNKKAPAPPVPVPIPIPAPRSSLSSRQSLASSVMSSAKQSEAEESESGLSSVPKPPENELQKSHEHNPAALSEHQLRVQASLQRLNIPDWFRQYNQQSTTARSPDGANSTTLASATSYKPGNFTRKRTNESGRWVGLNSKTTSLSSLGSQRSDRSPLLLSPSAHSHHGGQTTTQTGTTGGVTTTGAHSTRWSTSHLNSTQTSPSVSQRGSFTRGGPVNSSFISVASGNSGNSVIRSSYRQPYLGWRSTEKLSQRTPHERLATSLLAQQQRTSPTQRLTTTTNGVGKLQQPVTPEIQSSIKEVTSAIVHYVNDQTNQQRSRSASPNSRKCWLESSFVGIRPLDSPQTPVIEGETPFNTAGATTTTTAINNNNNILSYIQQQQLLSNNLIQSERLAAGATTTASTADARLRMNGSIKTIAGAAERSLSNASLEDVLASLLGLPTSASAAGTGPSTSAEAYARSTGDSVSESYLSKHHMPQQLQQQNQLQVDLLAEEQQRLRRRSEGDAASQQKQKQHQLLQQQNATNASACTATTTATANTNNSQAAGTAHNNTTTINTHNTTPTAGTSLPTRRVSLGDSSLDSNNKTNNTTSVELYIKCRNNKCDHTATPADAKKYYKSCHNCSFIYCSRECRRAHWEKHRKACLHSRASNICRQVLATCKDDVDSQRHLSLLARKGFLSQGRGVVRVLFRSADAAEGFIKHGFQCMGEASYVRWPDLMPAEMGLELYSELLKLSTEYKPDSKMLIYVAICVVSEAPGMGTAPVRWERQLVSRCAKLKLCKTILAELEQQQLALQQQPLAVVAVPEPTTEILILTFNPNLRASTTHRELILSNILDILSRRGVLLRKHYPEIFQRLQTYTEGQTDKFNPVTLHPRDSQTGQSFVCIIMPVHSDSEIIKLPSAADGGNRVTTIDVGSPAALAQFDDDDLLTRTTS